MERLVPTFEALADACSHALSSLYAGANSDRFAYLLRTPQHTFAELLSSWAKAETEAKDQQNKIEETFKDLDIQFAREALSRGMSAEFRRSAISHVEGWRSYFEERLKMARAQAGASDGPRKTRASETRQIMSDPEAADIAGIESAPNQPVDLALSGGGFRATLFHLGVVGYLRDAGFLKRVRTICSVSGGSILAAHLVSHWDDYCSDDDGRFRNRVSQLAESIMSRDVSGNVLRKSDNRLLDLKPLDTEQLTDEYIDLLDLPRGRDRWDDVPTSRPALHILATHLNTGRVGAFCRDGFRILPVDAGHRHHTAIRGLGDFARSASITNQSIARAVAASSAFPPMFSPISLEPGDRTHMLTDGGVYDNSGVNYLLHLYKTAIKDASSRLVVVSDAARDFPTELRGEYDTFMTLALRVTDAQGGRIAEMDSQAARAFLEKEKKDAVFLSIHDSVAPLPSVLSLK